MLKHAGKTKPQEHKRNLGNPHEVLFQLGPETGVILTDCNKRWGAEQAKSLGQEKAGRS